jgi:hypothetical protein
LSRLVGHCLPRPPPPATGLPSSSSASAAVAPSQGPASDRRLLLLLQPPRHVLVSVQGEPPRSAVNGFPGPLHVQPSKVDAGASPRSMLPKVMSSTSGGAGVDIATTTCYKGRRSLLQGRPCFATTGGSWPALLLVVAALLQGKGGVATWDAGTCYSGC